MIRSTLLALLVHGIAGPGSARADASSPDESVIDVPAIGEGLCVHNLFQSNMVLQRDKPIRVWGWADPGTQITASIGDDQANVQAGEDRGWEIVLPARPACAEPCRLVVEGADRTVTFDNVLFGDVWLLGGQSNMEHPLSRIENGALEIVSANYPQIRVLTVPVDEGPEEAKSFPRLMEWSGWFSRHFRKGYWDVCTPDAVRELSAIGFVFARRIHTASQIPIGVIDASRGGTTVETWTPAARIEGLDAPAVAALRASWEEKLAAWDPEQDLARRVEQFDKETERLREQGRPIPADRVPPTDLRPGPARDHNRPGNCYAGMIAPLAGLSLKGVIFHQGYNNCFDGTRGAEMYRHVFPEMIAAWRNAFDDPGLPFGILSLCTEGTAQTRDHFAEAMFNAGPYIREAQYQTFLQLADAGDEHLGFVSTYDLRRRWYHPQLKIPAGERIARWALATQYEMKGQLQWEPPRLESAEVDGSRMILRMDRAVGAVDDGGPIVGFALAGTDRRFHPADADFLQIGEDDRGRPKLDHAALVLTSPMVPAPLHFRYAWARSPLGNLQTRNMSDVPFATQRSDHWRMEAIPLGVLGDDPPETITRAQRNEILRALREVDLDRRRKEAEAFLREHPVKERAGGAP